MEEKGRKINVCIAGITGWVGRELASAIYNSEIFTLVGAVARKTAGKQVRDILGLKNCDVEISSNVKEAFANKPDVMIDYTSASSIYDNTVEALKNGVNVVIGSSGLDDLQYSHINQLAKEKRLGVAAAGNFSTASALMLHFSLVAAKYMKSWEIIDYASWEKRDSPSGTALELANRLSMERDPQRVVNEDEMTGKKESRGATINGINTHSVRLPGFIIGAEVIFGTQDQRLSIRYDGGESAAPYVQGTLLAARKVLEFKGLIRGMDLIMGL